MNEEIVAQARFDPKLRFYLYLRSMGILTLTIIGIPFLPIWGFAGWMWAGKYFASLRCDLTNRRLRIHKGVVFQQDKTIPLDKIQDLSLRHGPIQRMLGVCSLRIETAGQSSGQGQADADLIGITDVHAFQEMVLATRDRLEARSLSGETDRERGKEESGSDVLLQIRDTLQRIEEHLGAGRNVPR